MIWQKLTVNFFLKVTEFMQTDRQKTLNDKIKIVQYENVSQN